MNQLILTQHNLQDIFNRSLITFDFNEVRNVKTRKDYSKAVRAYKLHAGDADFAPAAVQEYMDFLTANGYANSTITQRKSALMKIVNSIAKKARAIIATNAEMVAMRAEVLNRCESFKDIELTLESGVRNATWLTKAEMSLLFNAPFGRTEGRDKAILGLMLGAGLRRGEINKLTKENFKVIDGKMYIYNFIGKGNKVRTAPLTTWATEAMEHVLDTTDSDDDLLFDISEVTVSQRVKRWAKVVGVDASAHTCRRSYAREMYLAGVDLYRLSLILGHADTRTTALYIGSDLELIDLPSFLL